VPSARTLAVRGFRSSPGKGKLPGSPPRFGIRLPLCREASETVLSSSLGCASSACSFWFGILLQPCDAVPHVAGTVTQLLRNDHFAVPCLHTFCVSPGTKGMHLPAEFLWFNVFRASPLAIIFVLLVLSKFGRGGVPSRCSHSLALVPRALGALRHPRELTACAVCPVCSPRPPSPAAPSRRGTSC